MKIYFICNNPILKPKLQAYFSAQKVELLPYEFEKKLPRRVNHLLIVEPFYIRGDYYSIYTIWKSFFIRLKHTDIKLMVAGFGQINYCNYLNLFNVPADLPSWINNTHDLEYGIEYMQDEFNADVIKQMTKFFKGHDQISLFEKLNYWEQSVKNIQSAINGTISRSYRQALRQVFPMAQEQWREFEHRWRSYKAFFSCCPFANEKRNIIQLLERIEPYFIHPKPNESLFIKVQCTDSLSQIRKELIKMDQYVRPEIYE